MSLRVERVRPGILNELTAELPEGASLPQGAAPRLLERLDRLVGGPATIDAWTVERGGRVDAPFHWTARRARRTLGRRALERVRGERAASLVEAVDDEIDDLRARAATGQVHPRSLAAWIGSLDAITTALVATAAVSWCVEVDDLVGALETPWRAAADLSVRSRPGGLTLRAHRDVVVATPGRAALLRVRSGHPGPSAGAGLRTELAIAALARRDGRAPSRVIGLWPEAGLAISVDGDERALRAGARDLVAVARRLGSGLLAA